MPLISPPCDGEGACPAAEKKAREDAVQQGKEARNARW
eukprot:SAG22_NODE_17791_length_298_cov_0.894472_1_plen_37_part_01